MRNIRIGIREFFERDWTLAEKILMLICGVLAGIAAGFLFAPVKRGISCGNNNGNTYNQLEDDYWLDEED